MGSIGACCPEAGVDGAGTAGGIIDGGDTEGDGGIADDGIAAGGIADGGDIDDGIAAGGIAAGGIAAGGIAAGGIAEGGFIRLGEEGAALGADADDGAYAPGGIRLTCSCVGTAGGDGENSGCIGSDAALPNAVDPPEGELRR